MENIYEKMSRWGDEKKAYDEHFWNEMYPKMDWESKLVFWRKDIFNAMNRYGVDAIPNDWIIERTAKDVDFEAIMKAVIMKLS